MKSKTRNLLVYKYEFWDEKSRSMRASETYATLDAIVKGGVIPLIESGMVAKRCGIYHELVESPCTAVKAVAKDVEAQPKKK